MKNKTRSFAALAAIGALFAASQSAQATPVSYYGALFDLSIVDIGAVGGTYEVTYSADFSGFTNGGVQPFIDSIAWKHAGADVTSVSLVSDPGSGWVSFTDATVNAGGCSSSGGMTWACAADNLPPFVATLGVQTWVFHATFDGTLTSTSTTGDSIKARFVNANGGKEGALLSCKLDDSQDDNCYTTTRVPEPASMLLFGAGLLGLGLSARRKHVG